MSRLPLPSDMKQEGLIDIVKTRNLDNASYTRYRKVSPNKFRIYSDPETVAFEFQDTKQWLMTNVSTAYMNTLVHSMNSLTENGTWSAADNGTNIVRNTYNYISGDASVEVDMSGGGTTLSIVNSTMSVVDLSNISKLFYWVYLPTVENLTSAQISYGVDGSNYYLSSTTRPFNVDEFELGWNFIGFDPGTLTGTVDLENIDYLKLSLVFSSAPSTLEGFLFDNVLAAKGDPAEIIYYSKYPWRSTDGTYKQNSTSNEDILNCDEEEYAVWLKEILAEVAPTIPMSSEDIAIINKERDIASQKYKQRFPSQRIKDRMYWYRPTQTIPKRGGGRSPRLILNNE